MKKTLALLMSMALILSVVAGLAVSTSAAPAFVNETYKLQDYIAEFGTHHTDGKMTFDESSGGYVRSEGFTFGDNTWTYECWDPHANDDKGEFKPMTVYYASGYQGEWAHGGWTNFYTADANSAWTKNYMTYCSVGNNGKRLHPGDEGGVVVTFTVPATGVISYDLSISLYGGTGRDQASGKGDILALYVNDTRIWPAAGQPDCVVFSDTASSAEPYAVSVESFSVKEGDKVRFMVTTNNGNNGSAGTDLVDFPVVTYHSADVPVGDPKGVAPEGIMVNRAGQNTTDHEVVWNPAKNAGGYNVYLKGPNDAEFKKVNTAPITECTYKLTGLEAKTLYEVKVSTIPASNPNGESDHSEAQAFMTGKGADTGTDTDGGGDPTTDVVDPSNTDTNTNTNTNTNSGSNSASNTGAASSNTNKVEEKKGLPVGALVAIIAGGVAVVAVAAVVVVVVMKKKAALNLPEEPKE